MRDESGRETDERREREKAGGAGAANTAGERRRETEKRLGSSTMKKGPSARLYNETLYTNVTIIDR